MSVFVDTSALFAVLDADDEHHAAAARVWRELLESGEPLLCSNDVLVETFALVQRRLGFEAVRVLDRDVLPAVRTLWIDEEIHRVALGGCSAPPAGISVSSTVPASRSCAGSIWPARSPSMLTSASRDSSCFRDRLAATSGSHHETRIGR